MKNEVLIGGLVLIIALAGLLWLAGTHSTSPNSQTTATTTTSAELQETLGSITENSQYYQIQVSYPTSTPLKATAGDAADAAAIAKFKTDMDSIVSSFKKNTDPSQIPDAVKKDMGLGTSRKFALQSSYIATSSPAVLSYIFQVFADSAGAHPDTGVVIENFDTKTGAHLALADLFANPNFLTTLQNKSRAALTTQIAAAENRPASEIDKNMLNSGTEAKAENYQLWYLANGSLVIVFPLYQVAPYVDGIQTVSIPTNDLKSLLKPQYQ